MQRKTLALLISAPVIAAFLLTGQSAWAGAVQDEPTRLMKDRDLSGLARKLGAWFTLTEENEDTLKAEQDFRDELEKINKKRLRGGDLLSSPADLGMTVFLAQGYPKKAPKSVNGKIAMRSETFRDLTVEYAIWTPSKYNAKKGPVTLLLTIPGEGINPKDHIQQYWTNSEFKENTIIASPKMPGDSKTWTESAGRQALLLTLRFVSKTWAVDTNRIFIGGRGRGGEAALALAHTSPDRFAGAFCWAGDGGDGLDPENLRHTPVMISGAGARARGLEERAVAAGIDSIKIVQDAAEKEFINWFKEKSRVNYPTKISVVPQGRYPYRSHWIQFAPVSDTEGVRVDAEVNRETNTITVTSSGIREVSVFFCDELVDLTKPVTVIANGKETRTKVSRSVSTFLEFLLYGKNDSGRVFVATKQFNLPPLAKTSDEKSDDSK